MGGIAIALRDEGSIDSLGILLGSSLKRASNPADTQVVVWGGVAMALDKEMATMLYGKDMEFTPDLTSREKQLCAWVAERASAGVKRIFYREAMVALGIPDDREITQILSQLRERVDDVHSMIEFPIVNTTAPYFDIHRNADYIWDGYCRAERESLCLEDDVCLGQIRGVAISQRDREVCCV